MNRFEQTICDVIKAGGGNNYQNYRAASERIADREFYAFFLGVISCVVDPELWREAVKRAEELYRESHAKGGRP